MLIGNEELEVLAHLASEVVELRKENAAKQGQIDRLCADLDAERKRAREDEDEGNNLRAEQASLMNSITEYKADAENAAKECLEARQKLGEWAKFINFTVYRSLHLAQKRRNARFIAQDVRAVMSSMKKFQQEHPVTITDGANGLEAR